MFVSQVSYSSVVEHPKYQSEGRRFDSCWEHSDFSFNPSMSVSLTDKHPLSSIILFTRLVLKTICTTDIRVPFSISLTTTIADMHNLS